MKGTPEPFQYQATMSYMPWLFRQNSMGEGREKTISNN